MGQYQRLLLVADQTLHQSPAMLRAMALAKASGAALDVRAFVEPVPVAHLWEERIDEVDAQRYLRRYRRWIADEVERLNGHGLKVTVDVVFTTPVAGDSQDRAGTQARSADQGCGAGASAETGVHHAARLSLAA
jgi:nucleotide-binding universal stress UspA family protein